MDKLFLFLPYYPLFNFGNFNLAGSFLNTEFKKGSNIIVNLDANGEVEISLTEGTAAPVEDDDTSDIPQRRRFALSTMRKRKKEKVEPDPVEVS